MLRSLIVVVSIFYFSSKVWCEYNPEQQRIFEMTLQNSSNGREMIRSYMEENPSLDNDSKGLNYNIYALSFAIEGNNDSAIVYFDKAISLLDEQHEMLPKIIKNKAIAYRNYNDLEKALELLNEALIVSQQQNNQKALVLIYSELSSVYNLLHMDQEAIKYVKEAITLIEELEPNSAALATTKQKLGNLYRRSGDFVFAKKIYDEILPLMEEQGDIYSYLLTKINYIDIIAHFDGDIKALNYMSDIYANIQDTENSFLLKLFYHKKAIILYRQKDKAAQDFFEKSFELAISNNSTYSLSIINYYIAFLLEEELFAELTQIFSQLTISEETSSSPLGDLLNFFQYKSTFYERNGNYKFAFEAFQTMHNVQEEIQSRNEQMISAELKEKYKNELLEKENELLIKNAELVRRKNALIIFSLSIVSGFIAFIAYFSWWKKRVTEKEKSFVKVKLDAEYALKELRQKTIKDQKREIKQAMLKNIELNKRLTNFKIALAEEQKSKSIIEQFEQLNIEGENWEEIANKMRIIEKDFFNKLLSNHPNLTDKDIEFCTYVRMGLSYKKIAEIFNISHNSVFTKKYRLMKKLNLDKEVDFKKWILKL